MWSECPWQWTWSLLKSIYITVLFIIRLRTDWGNHGREKRDKLEIQYVEMCMQHSVTCVSIDIDGHSTENGGACTILLFFSGSIKFELLVQLGDLGSHVATLQKRRRAVTEEGASSVTKMFTCKIPMLKWPFTGIKHSINTSHSVTYHTVFLHWGVPCPYNGVISTTCSWLWWHDRFHTHSFFPTIVTTGIGFLLWPSISTHTELPESTEGKLFIMYRSIQVKVGFRQSVSASLMGHLINLLEEKC